MQKSDVENADELARLLFELTQVEGSCVVLVHPNADYIGPDQTVYVRAESGEPVQYFGKSVIGCLKQAVKANALCATCDGRGCPVCIG